MQAIIEARGVRKAYGNFQALNGVDLTVEAGRIVGLIGPNGAGKTTFLKGLLGLAPVEGELQVLGMDPRRQRTELLEQVSFIADTATLPRWIRVTELLDFMAGLHPRFDRDKAKNQLTRTDVSPRHRVRELSKGMITQLHLALIMAIDSKLLVLDEPTLGLDILYRKQFYSTLLEDYFDEHKTILITTHQVEEIEHLLTDVVFIKNGRICLNTAMDAIDQTYSELQVNTENIAAAQALGPLYSQSTLGGRAMIFEKVPRENLASLGQIKTPRLADLFVATMQASNPQGAQGHE